MFSVLTLPNKSSTNSTHYPRYCQESLISSIFSTKVRSISLAACAVLAFREKLTLYAQHSTASKRSSLHSSSCCQNGEQGIPIDEKPCCLTLARDGVCTNLKPRSHISLTISRELWRRSLCLIMRLHYSSVFSAIFCTCAWCSIQTRSMVLHQKPLASDWRNKHSSNKSMVTHRPRAIIT